MNTFTVKDIMNQKPCPDYTEEVVKDLWAGREELTVKEICNLDISVEDRIWVAARLASKATVVSWANYCADEAQKHAAAANAAPFAAANAASYAASYASYANTSHAAACAANAAHAARANTAWATCDAAAACAAYANAASNAASWSKAQNEELERLLFKLVEMNKAE